MQYICIAQTREKQNNRDVEKAMVWIRSKTGEGKGETGGGKGETGGGRGRLE